MNIFLFTSNLSSTTMDNNKRIQFYQQKIEFSKILMKQYPILHPIDQSFAKTQNNSIPSYQAQIEKLSTEIKK